MPHNSSVPVAGDASLLAEQAILATLFVYPDRIEAIRGTMTGDDFGEPLHAAIFEAVCSMHDLGETPSVTAITARLGNQRLAEGVNVRDYLTNLVLEAAGPRQSVDGNARAVRDAAGMRQLQDIAADLQIALSTGAIIDPVPLANKLVAQADTIIGASLTDSNKPMTLGSASRLALQNAVRVKSGEVKPGIMTGLPELDKVLHGFKGGQLIVLAGRPAMGKTALALKFGLNAAHNGDAAEMFSLEMPATDLAERALSAETALSGSYGVEYERIAAGDFNDEEEQRLFEALDALDTLPFYIEQRSGLSIGQLCASARRYVAAQRAKGIKNIVLIVDYLSLVRSGDRYKGNRVSEVGEVTRGLKALAKELNVPVVLLCQLNRQVENRDDKRPVMADLRESGEIEQDADVILFVYREEYYLANQSQENMTSEELLDHDRRLRACQNIMEIIVAKQRKGRTGTVKALVDLGCNVVHELSRRIA
jgi:replicative DNA helicase